MDIYCLKSDDGRLFHPSVQATVLAKYSRSPDSARDIVKNLTEEESDRFHSKWTVSYGHSSVAELACIPICFEGVSIIASKFIEKFQRSGYSEKSTRYQKFDKDSFISPTDNDETAKKFASRYYTAYDEIYPLALKRAGELMGETNLDLPKVKARAFDSIRYLLPAGTGTNLAAVMNLRDVRYLISEALSHDNHEIRKIGLKVRETVSEMCPALISNIETGVFDPPVMNSTKVRGDIPSEPSVRVLSHDSNGERKIKKFVEESYGMSWEHFDYKMENRGNHRVPSVFKLVDIELELVMDYGAFRDLQRHRRCEQFSEFLTTFYGYSVPDDFRGTNLENIYTEIMNQAPLFNESNMHSCQYVIPIGYHHRSIFKMDLAELYYIVELRTKPQGHVSYRRIAYQIYEQAKTLYPELMKWCKAVNPTSIGDHI